MSKHPFDSFLPSGAIESPRTFPHSSSMMARQVPRSIPDFTLSHSSSSTPSPNTLLQSRSPSKHPHGPPISPPKTRSGSAEESSAALVENWRIYTDRLRSQSEGERRHMAADRAMMEEVMAEERSLWEQERNILKARIAELEAQVGSTRRGDHQPIPYAARPGLLQKRSTSSGSNSGSASGRHEGSSSSIRTVPQESGRDADGTPFYAPAPRNPSRTFESFESSNLRVDSIVTEGETPIRVTSKELTASDFGVHSHHNHDLEAIPESPKSIDISQLQPTLEGVAIKASAVSPTFVAKVLSPQKTPQRLSPDKKPSPRNATNLSPPGGTRSERRVNQTLEVAIQPENKRLTMHAGHTPNHSITNFSTLLGTDGESGNATPTQAHHEEPHVDEPEHEPEYEPEHGHQHATFAIGGSEEEEETEERDDEVELDNGDMALTGQLGFTNDEEKDDPFFKTLVEKLEEAKRSTEVSPVLERSEQSVSMFHPVEEPEEDDEEKDEGPKLKLRPSTNFGKPLGQA